jgi:hypothetical protein
MRMQDAAEEIPSPRPVAYIPIAATPTMFPDNVISNFTIWVLRTRPPPHIHPNVRQVCEGWRDRRAKVNILVERP